jgi:hypothetical protein
MHSSRSHRFVFQVGRRQLGTYRRISGNRVSQDLKFIAEGRGARQATHRAHSGCSRTTDRTLFPRHHQRSPTVSCLATDTRSNKKMVFYLSAQAPFGSRLFHPREKYTIRNLMKIERLWSVWSARSSSDFLMASNGPSLVSSVSDDGTFLNACSGVQRSIERSPNA